MAATESGRSGPSRARVALFVLLGLGAVAAVVAFAGWNRTPQVGSDEEVFRTVDALFTAVTARDEKLLAQCDQRLQAHRDAGKLPADAADSLDRVVAKARAGSWETASERLYDFMKAQKREGAPSGPRKSPRRSGKISQATPTGGADAPRGAGTSPPRWKIATWQTPAGGVTLEG